MKTVSLILFLFSNFMFAQIQFDIDTSYTVQSTFKKEKIKFPFLEIVKEQNDDDVIKIKDLVYKKLETRVLHLDAFYKKENTKLPAVILIHGGGWKSGNKSQMQIMAQEIASKGYSCFAIEYRLSPEAKYPAAIFDVKTAIKFIKANAEKFNVDPSRIAVLGCSSGGQMAALIGTTNENSAFEDKGDWNQNAKVQAIIDMDGILAFKHPESQEGKVASLWLGGTYEEKPETWQQASALTHTDQNTPPILFINSDMIRFHAGRDNMIEILDKNGIYNEVQTIKNSPHSFWFFNPWFDEMINYTTQFLDKVFK
jgi:acetyl esterase/lipase